MPSQKTWSIMSKSSRSKFRSPIVIISAIVLIAIVLATYLPPVAFPDSSQALTLPNCCTTGSRSGYDQNKKPAQQPDRLDAAKDAAIKYYEEKYGDSQVTATAKDFGCHIEITIFKQGQQLKVLTYVNGRVYG